MTQALLFPGTERNDRSSTGRRGWNEQLPSQCSYVTDWLDKAEHEEITRRCRDLKLCRASTDVRSLGGATACDRMARCQ